MAYLIVVLAIAVAVLVLFGLRMVIGMSLSFMGTQEMEQTPIAIPSHTRVSKHR